MSKDKNDKKPTPAPEPVPAKKAETATKSTSKDAPQQGDKTPAKGRRLSPMLWAIIAIVLIGFGLGAYLYYDGQANRQYMAQLEARIAQLEARQPTDYSAQINALSSRLDQDIANLEQTITNTENQRDAALSMRIDLIAQEIQNLRAEFDSLRQQLSTLDAQGKVTINTNDASIAVLRDTLNQLDLRVQTLEQATSAQFNDPVLDDDQTRPPADIDLGELIAGFADAAHRAIQADVSANAQGNGQKLMAWLRSQVSLRTIEPKAGNDADAILSRVGAALAQNDLTAAMDELQQLGPEASAALGDWRAAFDAAVAQVQSQSNGDKK